MTQPEQHIAAIVVLLERVPLDTVTIDVPPRHCMSCVLAKLFAEQVRNGGIK